MALPTDLPIDYDIPVSGPQVTVDYTKGTILIQDLDPKTLRHDLESGRRIDNLLSHIYDDHRLWKNKPKENP